MTRDKSPGSRFRGLTAATRRVGLLVARSRSAVICMGSTPTRAPPLNAITVIVLTPGPVAVSSKSAHPEFPSGGTRTTFCSGDRAANPGASTTRVSGSPYGPTRNGSSGDSLPPGEGSGECSMATRTKSWTSSPGLTLSGSLPCRSRRTVSADSVSSRPVPGSACAAGTSSAPAGLFWGVRTPQASRVFGNLRQRRPGRVSEGPFGRPAVPLVRRRVLPELTEQIPHAEQGSYVGSPALRRGRTLADDERKLRAAEARNVGGHAPRHRLRGGD